MRLLFATDVPPFPPDHGSSVISYHWIEQLQSRHHVALFDAHPNGNGGRSSIPPPEWRVESERPTRGLRWAASASSLLGPLPRAPHAVARSGAREELTRIARAGRYDALVLVGPSMSGVLADGPLATPTVFVPYDSVASVLQRRLAVQPAGPRTLYARLEAARWARAEADLYPRAGACVAVTHEDASAISARWNDAARDRIMVIPNGVGALFLESPATLGEPHHVALTGNLGTSLTFESVKWFLAEVWPEVLAKEPRAKLSLAGRDPSAALLRLASGSPRVTVHANVPDMRAFLQTAAVHVCPMRVGSGIKNRLLEALAQGRACVATTLACAGVDGLDDQAVRVADDAQTFAAAVLELLVDENERLAMGRRARALVEQRYTWAARRPLMEKAIGIALEREHSSRDARLARASGSTRS